MSTSPSMRLAIVTTLLPLAVIAEPITLKGLAPGMTKEQLEQAHKGFTNNCVASTRLTGGETCGYLGRKLSLVDIPTLETFAGAPALRWLAILKDGVTNTVIVTLASNDFDRVSAALVERFGKPTSSEVSTVSNRMGVSFEQIETNWTRDGIVLKARKRGSKVDEMALYLTTLAAMQEINRDRTQVRPKADAKDM